MSAFQELFDIVYFVRALPYLHKFQNWVGNVQLKIILSQFRERQVIHAREYDYSLLSLHSLHGQKARKNMMIVAENVTNT